jgi:hypothetical protein
MADIWVTTAGILFSVLSLYALFNIDYIISALSINYGQYYMPLRLFMAFIVFTSFFTAIVGLFINKKLTI